MTMVPESEAKKDGNVDERGWLREDREPLVCPCCASTLTPEQHAEIVADLKILAAAAVTPYPAKEPTDG